MGYYVLPRTIWLTSRRHVGLAFRAPPKLFRRHLWSPQGPVTTRRAIASLVTHVAVTLGVPVYSVYVSTIREWRSPATTMSKHQSGQSFS